MERNPAFLDFDYWRNPNNNDSRTNYCEGGYRMKEFELDLKCGHTIIFRNIAGVVLTDAAVIVVTCDRDENGINIQFKFFQDEVAGFIHQ